MVAQELRQVGTPQITSACFDPVRGVVIALGAGGYSFDWNGTAWRQSADLGAPLSVHSHVEPNTGRLVCLTRAPGTLALSVVARIGNEWQLVPAAGPSPRDGMAVAYDAARGELLLFGGFDSYTTLGDTWTFDGTNWLQRLPANVPPARSGAAVAFDTQRQCVVMFGGFAGSALGDTWEWDGVDWQARTPSTQPLPRYFAKMVHDAARQRTVLLGGFSSGTTPVGDHWEYDGVDWTMQPAPPAAFTTGMPSTLVHDAARGETLAVGVMDPAAYSGEVWAWDGLTWSARPGWGPLPAFPWGRAAAPDPSGSGTLLFGGYASVASDGLWRFDGSAWSLVTTGGISARHEAVMWTQQGSAFVFGGYDVTGSVLGDTWRWSGANWTQVPGPGPGPRFFAAVAYDAVQDRAVLFGGMRYGGPFGLTVLADTWVFDGATWQQISASQAPPGRWRHSMGYDPARNRIVMFGGVDLSPQGAVTPRTDTWEWDGTNWQQVLTAVAPPADGSMAFDGGAQQLVYAAAIYPQGDLELWGFDGSAWTWLAIDGTSGGMGGLPVVDPVAVSGPNGQLLVLDRYGAHELLQLPARVAQFGTACGTVSTLAAGGLPQPGNASFALEVTQVPASLPVVAIAAAASTSMPVFGCDLLVDPAGATALALSSASGFATFALAVPPTPGLIGSDFYCQSVALDATAPMGLAFSAGMRIRIGE